MIIVSRFQAKDTESLLQTQYMHGLNGKKTNKKTQQKGLVLTGPPRRSNRKELLPASAASHLWTGSWMWLCGWCSSSAGIPTAL